ncbi:MAG: EAL domain-containing protein [Deltaproteobacteria bacterium]|nr:EAL domain-containing protein [Deltaproteobacteria bacterium]
MDSSQNNTAYKYRDIPNLKARILIPLCIAAVIFLAVFMLTLRYYHNKAVNEAAKETSATIERIFNQTLLNDMDFMHEVIEILEYDESLRLALKNRDSGELAKITMPHFKRMSREHRITHFYFHDRDRVNIIRLHKPEKSGDLISRFTALDAERKDQTAFGIELGPLGTFTLRVVTPLYYKTELAGYMELGEEIEHIIELIQHITKTEIYVLIDKEYLTRKKWEAGMQMMGRQGNWDLLPSYALINRSINDEIEAISTGLSEWEKNPIKKDLAFNIKEKKYLATFIPLHDAGQRRVGKILALHNITEQHVAAKYATMINAVTGLTLALLLILLFYGIAAGTEKKMKRSRDKLLEEAERREVMQEEHIRALEHLALHDTHTNLPNRNLLHNRIEHAVKVCKRRKECLGLIVLDILRLHEINDTLGHRNGDFLLQQIGTRLKKEFRETDTVARLSTESLGILLPSVDRVLLTPIIKKITHAFELPFIVEDFSITIEISMGVAFSPEHGLDAEMIIQRADVANRLAKQENVLYAIYDPDRDPFSKQRLTLMTELRSAINNNELYLLYQPKIDIKTGKVSAAEALLRWKHRERGIIPPDEFIPLAENTGVIHSLTAWVIKEGMKQLKKWEKEGLKLRLSINLSVRNIHDANFPAQLEELIKEARINPHLLNFEITENAIMSDPLYASEMLMKLKGMGISLSIDDFGKGYSSLSYLSSLPVDELKIDKGFVMGMSGNNNDIIIVRSTINLGKNLGLQVVAEGVEDKESLGKLADMGCTVAQGYFISKPLKSNAFKKWLKDSNCQFDWS